MTAVEWLTTKLQSFNVIKEEHYELLCQLELVAKQMDKEQKESFYKIGYLDGESKVRNFNENIYNETFKSE